MAASAEGAAADAAVSAADGVPESREGKGCACEICTGAQGDQGGKGKGRDGKGGKGVIGKGVIGKGVIGDQGGSSSSRSFAKGNGKWL